MMILRVLGCYVTVGLDRDGDVRLVSANRLLQRPGGLAVRHRLVAGAIHDQCLVQLALKRSHAEWAGTLPDGVGQSRTVKPGVKEAAQLLPCRFFSTGSEGSRCHGF